MKKNFHYIEFSRPNASVLKLLKALDENKNNVSAILSNKSFKNYVEACKKKLKHGKLGVVLRFNYKNKSFSHLHVCYVENNFHVFYNLHTTLEFL